MSTVENSKEYTNLLYIIFGLAGAVSILFAAGCGNSGGAPEFTGVSCVVRHVTEAPVIDGILTDDAWQTAEALPLGGPAGVQASTVRLLWNDQYLFVGFECQDMDAAATATGRDPAMSGQDHVTVLLDADADSVTFATVEVAATGAVRDAWVLADQISGNVKELAGWNCDGLRSSVTVYGGGAQPGTEDRFWTVEMAIPFDELVTAPHRPPIPGDRWLGNFLRTDQFERVMESGVIAPGADGRYAPASLAAIVFER